MLQNGYTCNFPTIGLIPGILNSGGGNDFQNLHFFFNSANYKTSGTFKHKDRKAVGQAYSDCRGPEASRLALTDNARAMLANYTKLEGA